VLLVGTGVYLTWVLRGLQLRILGHALYLALVVRREKDDEPGDISHFQALMTALAATVGTGNIAGVATAIATGGPGALFWMWVTGLVGMATKYAEAVLAVRYRRLDARGQMCGGPMYYLSEGLGMPWLGTLFGTLCVAGLTPILGEFALKFGPSEYFALMVLSL
jgi:AGCS family alanine or glycine:cation symporter